MEDAASHVGTVVGAVVSGSGAFEEGELGAAMAAARGLLAEVGADRQEGRRRRRRRWGGGIEVEAGGFLTNYFTYCIFGESN